MFRGRSLRSARPTQDNISNGLVPDTARLYFVSVARVDRGSCAKQKLVARRVTEIWVRERVHSRVIHPIPLSGCAGWNVTYHRLQRARFALLLRLRRCLPRLAFWGDEHLERERGIDNTVVFIWVVVFTPTASRNSEIHPAF